MKLAAKLIAALSLVAFATPALPCPAHKAQTTTAQADQDRTEKQAPAAKAAKGDKEKLAKSQKAKGAAAQPGGSAN